MNQIERITALMDLNACTDYVTFDVKGVEGKVRVVGACEAPWFCGRDVCAILQYKDIKQALQEHVLAHQKKSLKLLSSESSLSRGPNFLGVNNLSTEYHEGKTVYINESGFYRLINKSKTRLADAFQTLVCDYILPTLRRYGTVNIENIQKQLENLKLDQQKQSKIIELKTKELEEAQAAAKEAQDKAVKAERSAKWNKTMMKNVRIREKKMEWIYIATTRDYAKQRVFKIGSTKRLSKRLSGYQTGRLKKDEYYYAWYIKVYHAEELDRTIQKILEEFKHQKSKEMYQSIKFKDLKEIVNYICVNYDKSIEFLNDFVKNRLPISYEEEDTEDDIPPPICPEVIIRLNSEQEELFNVTAIINDLIQEYIRGIEASSRGTKDDPIVIQREDLMKMITEGIEEEIGIRSAWHTVKNLISWKNSKTPIEYEGKVYNIHYRSQ
jgi:prophage antirepressor-like protein